MTEPRDYKTRVVQEKQKTWFNTELDKVQARLWYGRIEIVFDAGLMKMIKVEEKRLPPR